MIRGHKNRLYPNDKQATYFAKACGTARFAYNWALTEWKERRDAGINIKENELRKLLNEIKREKYPWMAEVTKCAPQLAIKTDLNNAIGNFYAGRAGFPTYRKKGAHDSFSISNDHFEVKGAKVRIPLLGWVKMAEELRYDGRIIGAAISRRADKWYIAVQVEIPDPVTTNPCENQAVGVDLGIMSRVTLSDGTVVTGNKTSRRYESKLRRLNKELSRRKGAKKDEYKSKNFYKTKRKISRLYAKMADIRMDETHKLTTGLIRAFDVIGIEDLNVKNMMGNHRLARSIADMSFFEFRRQLQYKASESGKKLIVADKWFASSKICNVCGNKNDTLELSVREWTCANCGGKHNRDVNAAVNLKKYAIQMIS